MTQYNPITVQVPMVVTMTAQQVQDYVEEYGLADEAGSYRVKDVVDHVQSWALADVRRGSARERAEVSIKGKELL